MQPSKQSGSLMMCLTSKSMIRYCCRLNGLPLICPNLELTCHSLLFVCICTFCKFNFLLIQVPLRICFRDATSTNVWIFLNRFREKKCSTYLLWPHTWVFWMPWQDLNKSWQLQRINVYVFHCACPYFRICNSALHVWIYSEGFGFHSANSIQ